MSYIFNPFTGNLDSDSASGFIPLSQKGQPLGVATLDGAGKIPVGQLPNAVMEYQGAWDPNTNTPALSDGTGINGNVYYVTAARSTAVAGLTDPSMYNFQIGELIIYSTSVGKWQLVSPAAGVQSVNGYQGVVVLSTTDIAEGTNLYYTDTRARTAAVQDLITDGVTNIAPSQNAVFDALALKQPTGNYITALTGDITATGPGSVTGTLSTTGVSANSYGSATEVGTFTVDAKGRLSSASNTSIQITESQVTNLTTDLSGKANTALSNLSSVAINTALLPASAGTISLGSPTLYLLRTYARNYQSFNGSGVLQGQLYGDGLTTPSGATTGLNLINDSTSTINIGILSQSAGGVRTGSIYVESGNQTSSGFDSGLINIKSGDNTLAGNVNSTGSVLISSGNNSGTGAANSGPVTLKTGTVVGGTRGKIKLQDGSEGTVGHVWTESAVDGSGSWTALNAANPALSNLTSPTAVNQDLILNAGKTLIVPNNTFIKVRNAANSANLNVIKLDNANNVIIEDGANNTVFSADSTSRFAYDETSSPAVEFTSTQRNLFYPAGNQVSVDWLNGYLVTTANVVTVDYANSVLRHSTGAPFGTEIFNWESGLIKSPDSANSIDVFNRELLTTAGTGNVFKWGALTSGSNGQVLSTDGSGNISWVTPSSGSPILSHTRFFENSGNVTISAPGNAFDNVGFQITAGDLLWLNAQTTSTENGLWVWNGAAVPLTRPTGWTNGSVIPAYTKIYVYESTYPVRQENPHTTWLVGLTAKTVGTDDLKAVLVGYSEKITTTLTPSSGGIDIGTIEYPFNNVIATQHQGNGFYSIGGGEGMSFSSSAGLTISSSGVVLGNSLLIETQGDTDDTTGQLTIKTGQEVGSTDIITGSIQIYSGIADSNASGDISLFSGESNDVNGAGVDSHRSGTINIYSGQGLSGSGSGDVNIYSGVTDAGGGTSGSINISAGVPDGGSRGSVTIAGSSINTTSDGDSTLSSGSSMYVQGSSLTKISSLNDIELDAPINLNVTNAGTTFRLPKTTTSAGTTGNQTIDTITGTVNIAAGNSSVVVTNNKTTANGSIVFATIRTNDATAQIKNVATANGSFTINLVSPVTAETSIGFLVLN